MSHKDSCIQRAFETSSRGEVLFAPPGISHQQTNSELVNSIIAKYDQALQEARETKPKQCRNGE